MPLALTRQSDNYIAYLRGVQGEYYDIYDDIVKRYHLNISAAIMREQAYHYARAKADSHFAVFEDAFKPEHLGNLINAIINAIVGISLSVVSVGVSSAIGIGTLVGTSTSASLELSLQMASAIVGAQASHAIKFYTQEGQSLTRARALVGYRGRSSLSHALIYHPYAILAGGEIYQQEDPGRLGYPAGLRAPHCMRGILGEDTPSPLSAQLNNTAHKYLAGNAHYDPLALPMPKNVFVAPTRAHTQALIEAMHARMQEIQTGFKELSAHYFGFKDTSLLEELFNAHERASVHPKIDALNSLRFLEQMRYYSLGERLPLFAHIPYPQSLRLPRWQDRARGVIEEVQRVGHFHAIPKGLNRTWDYRQASADSFYRGNSKSGDREHFYYYYEELHYYYDYEGQVLLGEYSRLQEHYIRPQSAHKIACDPGGSVILARTRLKTPPAPNAQVQQYLELGSEGRYGLDVDHAYALECAYQSHLIAYWDCFSVRVIGVSMGDILEEAQAFARANDCAFEDVFFNPKAPTPQTHTQAAMFKEYIQAHMFKEYAALKA
ncbi:hypothetical protein ACFOPX_03450 [Helicobacter baculiformis]|uniref:Uncharacterized protein n=1 Tax=Helicobacter baculiformis TaxID=427351 RepID=A0ABV7ZJF7_9HELI|nr:hypothetical protein [Helicobacter baculiformis]